MLLYVVWATKGGALFFEQAQEFVNKVDALERSVATVFDEGLGIHKPTRIKTIGGDDVSILAVDHVSVLTEDQVLQYPRSMTGHPDGVPDPEPIEMEGDS